MKTTIENNHIVENTRFIVVQKSLRSLILPSKGSSTNSIGDHGITS